MSTFTVISLVNGLLRINTGCTVLSASAPLYDGFSKLIVVAVSIYTTRMQLQKPLFIIKLKLGNYINHASASYLHNTV